MVPPDGFTVGISPGRCPGERLFSHLMVALTMAVRRAHQLLPNAYAPSEGEPDTAWRSYHGVVTVNYDLDF